MAGEFLERGYGVIIASSSRKNLAIAKRKLESVHVKIFGIILSRFDAKKTSGQSGYYYSYNDYYYSYDK